MDFIGVDKNQKTTMRDHLKDGLDADAGLKRGVQDEIRSRTQHSVDIQSKLDLSKGPEHLKSGAYTLCEFFFVAFFTAEFLIGLCDYGGRGFCKNLWNLFDGLIVVAGI